MKFTAKFGGLVDSATFQGEFTSSRTLDSWFPYSSVETKEVCSEMFMGSTLPCICGGSAMFVAVSGYDDGHEDWFFQCLECEREWALRSVKVTFRKVEYE